jgi:hypothetical protein
MLPGSAQSEFELQQIDGPLTQLPLPSQWSLEVQTFPSLQGADAGAFVIVQDGVLLQV